MAARQRDAAAKDTATCNAMIIGRKCRVSGPDTVTVTEFKKEKKTMRTPSYFDGEVSFGAVTKAERLVAERLSRRRRDTFVVVPGVRQRAQQAQGKTARLECAQLSVNGAAATVLQQWWRDLLQQRVVSVVKVQAWWRGIRQRRQVRPSTTVFLCKWLNPEQQIIVHRTASGGQDGAAGDSRMAWTSR